MSDDNASTDPSAANSGAPAARRPNPAATAASRARRIGGTRPAGAASRNGGSATAALRQGDSSGTVATATTSTPPNLSKEPVGSTVVAHEPVKTKVVTQVPGWFRWVPALVLGVCAIVMIVLVAATSHGVWYAKPSASSVRDQVLAAAKTCTATTNTYKYTNVARYEAAGVKCTTGAFTSSYKQAMSSLVQPKAAKLKASQSVQINSAGVETISDSGTQWTVVLYGQTTINLTGVKDRVDPFSAVVRMDRTGGKWLISNICLVTAPSGSTANSC